MNTADIRKILNDTAFVHTSATAEEARVAEYLKAYAEKLGVEAKIEPFDVAMGNVRSAKLTVDGEEIPCEGYMLSGSAVVEAPLYYMPNDDKYSLLGCRGKIVMTDGGMGIWAYKDIFEAGAVGFITYSGGYFEADNDIDRKELRPYVSNGNILPGVNINGKDAARIRRSDARTARIEIEQDDEFTAQSHNVVAEIAGQSDEFIAFTAHYDTTSLSQGSYDNMSGCVGLLHAIEALKKGAPHRYGLRFIFCGSEERGLLGSKAYVAAHKDELEKCALNINLDMLGSVVGRFIACCTSDDEFVSFIKYYCAIKGFAISARAGVYSSDSTPFADNGVPAVSFARLGAPGMTPIHCRHDTPEEVLPEQLLIDAEFVSSFAEVMADAKLCPVNREMPEKIKADLDNYLGRKRRVDPR